MRLLTLGLLAACALPLAAQDVSDRLSVVPLTPGSRAYRVTGPTMLGVDAADPSLLRFRFAHPRAGVMRDMGMAKRLLSKDSMRIHLSEEPETVTALGTVPLGPGGFPQDVPSLQWVALRGAEGDEMYYFDHVPRILEYPDSMLLATSADMLPRAEYDRAMETASSKPSYSVPGEQTPELVESYTVQIPAIGLGGGFSKSTIMKYELKPEGERGKGLLGKNYTSDASFAKGSAHEVFDGTNRKFAYVSIATHNDIATGNAVVVGGLKYKKDKTKKGSEFREFLLLGVDAEGEVIEQTEFTSDEPVLAKGVFPLQSRPVYPNYNMSPTAAILYRGAGRKNDPDVDGSLRRVLIVDANEAAVLGEYEIDLPGDGYSALDEVTDTLGRTVVYEYDGETGEVIPTLITADGIRMGEPLFGERAADAQGLELYGNKFVDQAIVNLGDGRSLRVYKNQIKSQSGVGLQATEVTTDQGYVMFVLDETGMAVAGVPLRSAKALTVVGKEGSRVLLTGDFQEGETPSEPRFLEYDAATGEVITTPGPPGLTQQASKAVSYFDPANGAFYKMVRSPLDGTFSLVTYVMGGAE